MIVLGHIQGLLLQWRLNGASPILAPLDGINPIQTFAFHPQDQLALSLEFREAGYQVLAVEGFQIEHERSFDLLPKGVKHFR